jgi:hypothetical protein
VLAFADGEHSQVERAVVVEQVDLLGVDSQSSSRA